MVRKSRCGSLAYSARHLSVMHHVVQLVRATVVASGTKMHGPTKGPMHHGNHSPLTANPLFTNTRPVSPHNIELVLMVGRLLNGTSRLRFDGVDCTSLQ